LLNYDVDEIEKPVSVSLIKNLAGDHPCFMERII